MAEIHVQPKKKTTPVWVWLLIGLLVLAVIAFILLRNKKTDQTNTQGQPPTSLAQPAHNQLLPYA